MSTTPQGPAVLRGVRLQGRGQAIGHPAERKAGAVASRAAETEHELALRTACELRFLAAQQAGHAEGLRQGRAAAQAEAARAAEAGAREHQATAERQRLERVALDEQHQREHDARIARFDRLLQAVPAAAAKRLEELELDSVALAYAAARRIIGEQVHQHATIEHLVRSGIAQLHGSALERIRLHPADLEALQQHAEGRALMERHGGVEWRADPGLEGGGCLIDSAAGTLDARIESQLAQLRRAWAEALANPGQG